jgi:ketosteroid isomerase-like protein
MNRFRTHALAAAMACFVLFAIMAVAAPAAVAENQAVLQSDHDLLEAIAKADQPAAEALLDADFTRTDRAGKTFSRQETLQNLAALAAENEEQVVVRNYRQVVLVTGLHRLPAQNVRVRFVRAWVQRAAGWRALAFQETIFAEKLPEHRLGFGSPSGGAPVDCENPCKTVPYHPEGKSEQEVVAMWQGVERSVLANDVDAWIPGFTEDFIFVTPDGAPPMNKSDRIAMIKELKRTSKTLIPPQVVSMQVWALGDSAVMRSEHKPLKGRVLHVTRVFVKTSGHWQIAFGQQTVVEAPPSATP